MNKDIKQDIKDIKKEVNYFYGLYKKHGSEELYTCLINSLQKYLNSLNIENTKTNEHYTISFIIDREYLLFYSNCDKNFGIFDKYRNYHFDNENKLFEYIENKLLRKEANNN